MFSLRWRLTLTYTAVLAFTLLVLGAIVYGALHRYLVREADRELQRLALEVAYRLEVPRGRGWRGMAFAHISVFSSPGTYFQIVDGKGEVIARSSNLGTESLPVAPGTLELAHQTRGFFQTVAVDGAKLRIYNHTLLINGELAGVLQVGRSLEAVTNMMSRLAQVMFLMSFVIVGLATGIGYWLARVALVPVERLTRVADTISETQDLEQRVDYRGPPDEIGRLAATFNKMLEGLATARRSLTEAYASQRRFVADVSHELRTPLTIIRGNLELLRQMEGAGESKEEILADVTGEAERMSRLLNNLLILARADAGQHIEKSCIDLGTFVQDIARQAPLLGPTRFLTDDLGVLTGAKVMGDPDYLKQLLLILLENAFKYTPQTGEIALRACRKEGWYGVSVSDTGQGIPPEEVPRIFERFYRGPAGRSGTGLGLAIARWIAEEHGGHLEVTSQPGRGTTFTLWLPAVSAENS